jgi:hypothetical protein
MGAHAEKGWAERAAARGRQLSSTSYGFGGEDPDQDPEFAVGKVRMAEPAGRVLVQGTGRAKSASAGLQGHTTLSDPGRVGSDATSPIQGRAACRLVRTVLYTTLTNNAH